MGISLGLDIIPASIDGCAWAEVYEESLRLLRAHPARLVGVTGETVRGLRRLVYTQALERDKDGPRRRWHVVGDQRSGQTAESFEIYRDLGHHDGHRGHRPTGGARDAAVEHIHDRATSVFHEKTQGHPYHEPLVAVLALVEDRLGPAAYAYGDIRVAEAARACAWASRVLGRRLDPPVCVRPEALHDRLAAQLEEATLLDACLDLHVGSPHRMLAVLGERTDRSGLDRWFAARLRGVAHGESPEQLGALQSLTEWLDAGLGFDRLAAIVCRHPEGPRFSPVALAKAALVARRLDDEGGIDARLHAWLSSMRLPVPEPEKRPKRAAWPTPRRVLARLGKLFPDDRVAIEAAVAREQAGKSAPKPIRAGPPAKLEPSTRLSDLVPAVPSAFEGDGAPLSATGLLLRSAALAARQATTALAAHPEIGPALRKGPELAWRVLVGATRGRPLFEETWAALDEERDVDLFVFILGLLALADREPNTTACRALLWDLPLCRRLQRATADASWRRAMDMVITDLQKSSE